MKLLIPVILCFMTSMAWSANAATSEPTAAGAVSLSEFTTKKFSSCIDGDEDCYGIALAKVLPNNIASNGTLIVYLHGLNGDFSEPFIKDGENSLASLIRKDFPGAAFVSLNNGKSPSWGKLEARFDITNNLRVLIKELKIKRIILIGNSMGAITALTYAATAPSSIQQRITGIIAISPCADLEDLYKLSTAPEVKPSLEASFVVKAGEGLNKFEQNSLNQYLAFMPADIKFAVITATADTVVPIALQQDVVRDLNNRSLIVKSFEIEGKSDPLPKKLILESAHFVME